MSMVYVKSTYFFWTYTLYNIFLVVSIIVYLPLFIFIFIVALLLAPIFLIIIYPLNWGFEMATFTHDNVVNTFQNLNPFKKKPEGYQASQPTSATALDVRKSIKQSETIRLGKDVHTDEEQPESNHTPDNNTTNI